MFVCIHSQPHTKHTFYFFRKLVSLEMFQTWSEQTIWLVQFHRVIKRSNLIGPNCSTLRIGLWNKDKEFRFRATKIPFLEWLLKYVCLVCGLCPPVTGLHRPPLRTDIKKLHECKCGQNLCIFHHPGQSLEDRLRGHSYMTSSVGGGIPRSRQKERGCVNSVRDKGLGGGGKKIRTFCGHHIWKPLT